MALREILKRNRLEQKEVAQGIGVSRQTVWLWVNGHAVPTGENLVKLLSFLQTFQPDLSPAELLGVGEEAVAPTGTEG